MKNISQQNSVSKLFGFTGTAMLVSIGLASQVYAYNIINSQLDPGEKNADVTSLQQYLKDSPALYPAGLVTGYFGDLTTAAVIKFQSQYGLSQVGRVGPLTRDKLNSLITNGTPVVTVDTTAGLMVFMQYSPIVTGTSAVFNWTTPYENAYGRVYYSTSPLQMSEGDINSSGFAVTSGLSSSYDGVARTSQSITVVGLQPNTVYYYTVVATDQSGNVSIIGPNNTFRTAIQ
jgi:peptidoglycan hydrolase-like protein with peptidoglycan-binding domain